MKKLLTLLVGLLPLWLAAQINTFPYTEDFENGPGGWVASGTNSTWAWGGPSAPIINSAASGDSAWVTNLTGAYNNNECSEVRSPFFNFTNLSAPIIRVSVWWNSEASWDGTVLQASTDSGATWINVGQVGDPNNWYNDNSIDGFGTFSCNLGSLEGWAGRNASNNGSGGWVTAEHALNGLGGEPDVLLRFFFGSDGSVTDEGFGFDNVRIFNAPPFNAELVSFIRPNTGCGLSATDTVEVVYTNRGSQAFDSLRLVYRVNNGTPVREIDLRNVNPGDTLNYRFAATANLGTPGTYTFDAWVELANDTDLGNDSLLGITVIHKTPISAFPYLQTFDGPGWVPDNNCFTCGDNPPILLPGDWANDQNDGPQTPQDWAVRSAGVSSGSGITGPNADRSGSGNYLYVEDSFPFDNDSVILISPCFDIGSLSAPELSFWYWSGESGGGATVANVNELHIDVLANGQWGLNIIPAIRHDTAAWKKVQISLNSFISAGVIAVRFRVNNNNGTFTHDIAIDDFQITELLPNDAGVTAITAPLSSCGLDTAETVTVEVTNFGSAALDTVEIAYSVNGGTPVVQSTIFSPALATNTSGTFTFTTPANLAVPGVYTLRAWTQNLSGDSNLGNDSTLELIENVPVLSSFPYFENFESSRGGWAAFGTNSTWQWGLPRGNVIDTAFSGVKAWMTDTVNNYSNNECSFVLSPCFDMGNLGLPIFRAKVWWDAELSWDGAKLQSSTDNGLTWVTIGAVGDPNNWYTDSTINGFANCNLDTEHGWSGDGPDGSGGWVTVEHNLRRLGGQPAVRLRIYFGSDGSVNGFDGFAFDDVEIFEAPPADAKAVALIRPESSCGLGIDTVAFSFTNNGSQDFDTAAVYYSVNGGTPVMETSTALLSPGDTSTYTFNTPFNFSTPGTYTVRAWVKVNGDLTAANDTIVAVVTSVPTISSFPYFEDFESDPGGWESDGTNNSWQWGLPRGFVIDTAFSGVKAWMTDTLTDYNNSECSYVISPCFDFTNLALPQIKFMIWWDCEFSWDGAILQATTNNGASWSTIGALGDPGNWYNDGTVNGLTTCVSGGQGWSGSGTNGSGGWVLAEHKMPSLAGASQVRLRIFFGSDGSVNFFDGFAFDDVEVSEVLPNDLGVVALASPANNACGDSMAPVELVIENFGSQPQTNFPVVAVINGTTNLNFTYPDTLRPEEKDTVLVGTFNSAGGGAFNILGYTDLSNDLARVNDSMMFNISLVTLPLPPVTVDDSTCVPADSLVLIAQGNADVYFWYDSASGGNLLASGDTFYTPLITQNTQFWVSGAARTQDTITTTFNDNNGCSGNFFNVTAGAADIGIDSFDMNIENFNSTEWVKVYYRPGTYTGFTNSPAGWTLLDSAQVAPAGGGNPTRVPIGGLSIPAGQTYALAVEVVGNNNINYTNTPVGTTISNSDLTITIGDGFCAPIFGGSIAGRQWNGTIYYTGIGCGSPRVAASARIATPPTVDLGPDRAACAGVTIDGTTPGAVSYLWSTGATTPSIVVGATGSYNLAVTNAQGCVGTDTINLLIQPSPMVDLGPDTTGCDQILLDAGNPGAQYAWSTGAQTQSIPVTASGTYYVDVTNTQGCTSTDTIQVTILPAPQVSLGPDKTECEEATLDAGSFPAGHSYLWSTGATTQTVTVSQTGLYTVTVTAPNGCSADDDVVVNILPNPVVDLGADTTACDSLVLDAGNPGSSYTWNTGETTRRISAKASGNFFVAVLDNNGCRASDTISVNIAESPQADFSFAYTGGNTVAFSNASTPTGTGVSYQWDFGDGAGSSTLTDPTYTYNLSGNYIVTLIVTTAECGSDTFELSLLGVDIEDDLFGGALSVFPNPNNGRFTITASQLQAESLAIVVFDMNGREVYDEKQRQVQGEFRHEVDLSTQPEGVYLLQVSDGERNFRKRIVVRR